MPIKVSVLDHLYNQLVLVFKKWLWLMIIYSGLRLAYALYNYKLLINDSFLSIVYGFVNGLRFDSRAILSLNFIFFLFFLLPLAWQQKKIWRATLYFVFIAVNTILIALNLVDIELINFNSRRLTPIFFTLAQDVGSQLPQLILYYWWIALAIFGLGWLLALGMPRPEIVVNLKLSQMQKKIRVLMLAMFFCLAYHCHLSFSPLSQVQAFRGSSSVGHLTLNTTFTFLGWRPVQPQVLQFFSESEMRAQLEQKMHLNESSKELSSLRPKNIVVIILESFALEYMGELVNNRPGYTPFLDELATKSLFFKNAFANGKRSIEVMPSVLVGFPSLLDEPFLQSTSQGIRLLGLPELLKSANFKSYFFHGAHNGSMFFDVFANRIGFDNYYGLNEYPENIKTKDSDQSWGILDEPYLQYFALELSKKETPFFATVFTLSSHQPYPVPAHLKEKFPDGTLAIHESIGYTDYALKKFFYTARQQPWYKDTLFVITADHTQLSDDKRYMNFLGKYRVPLLFYKEGQDWSGYNNDKVVQHADILPTVLDILDLPGKNKNYASNSVLNSDVKGFVVNRDSKGYWYFDGECFLWILMDGITQLESGPESCSGEPLDFFKAYIQNFTQRVSLDQWADPKN